jgi:N-acyl-D-amino-acid deacylase
VAIRGERIACVGACPGAAAKVVDAKGKAVAPGFVNMLSWSNESLIQDGRGLSELKQGITLEVMGEGDSMGPLTPR